MTNIWFFGTREEAKGFVNQMKKKGKTNLLMQKEKIPFEDKNGRLLYYSVSHRF